MKLDQVYDEKSTDDPDDDLEKYSRWLDGCFVGPISGCLFVHLLKLALNI